MTRAGLCMTRPWNSYYVPGKSNGLMTDPMVVWKRPRNFKNTLMTREKVETLARLLAPESPYFRLAFGIQPSQGPPSELERIDKALMDPSFGWNVAASYAAAGLPLPNLEWPSAMVRAHRYLSNPTLRDDNLVFALTLNLPENGAQRGLM